MHTWRTQATADSDLKTTGDFNLIHAQHTNIRRGRKWTVGAVSLSRWRRVEDETQTRKPKPTSPYMKTHIQKSKPTLKKNKKYK
ncbi:hypothetical protein FH972_017822 [Carpinus fangiana]|uniref:Uncharacterized protein n=1 Tax=Carpinus fangiana TaxID=176857 RepID=A0A5N6RKK8_9ROSI|nr:hypothetical protein FH972_017822 [Carpinus fangiana]